MSRVSLRRGLAVIFLFVALLSLLSILLINNYSQRSTKQIVEELAAVALVQMEQDAIEALRGLGFASLQERANELSQMDVISYIQLYNKGGEIVLSAGKMTEIAKPITYDLVDYKGSLPLILREKISRESIGYLKIGIDHSVLFSSYNLSQILYIILFVSVCTFSLLVINIFFSRRVLAPVGQIDSALTLMTTKPWDTPKLEHLYGDEIGEIAKKLDNTAATIFSIGRKTKSIESQLVIAEEKADAVLISSLASIAETAEKLDTSINSIDDHLVSLLSNIERDETTNANAKSIYNLMSHIRSHVSILQASGDINRNIMISTPKNIKLHKLISIISDTLSKDISINSEELQHMYCNIDYLRLAILLNKIVNMFVGFSVTNEIYEKGNEIVMTLSFVQHGTLNSKLTKTDVLQFLEVMETGKSSDIGDIRAVDIIYINVVINLLRGDFSLIWSNAHQSAMINVSIPLPIRSEKFTEFEAPRTDKKLSIVTDESPVVPSQFFMSRYGVSASITLINNINIEELASKDCVIFDCSSNNVDLSCEAANALRAYCFEHNVEQPKLGALFFKSEYNGDLVDKIINANFDFPYHKPYKLNKIISDYSLITESNSISFFDKRS